MRLFCDLCLRACKHTHAVLHIWTLLCVFVISPSTTCMFATVNKQRLNQVISSIHCIYSVCVGVCMCEFLGWKVSTVLMQLNFPQKEGRDEIKKKRKIDTAARFWWLSRGKTLANKWWVVRERRKKCTECLHHSVCMCVSVCVCERVHYSHTKPVQLYNLSVVKARGWCSVVLCEL